MSDNLFVFHLQLSCSGEFLANKVRIGTLRIQELYLYSKRSLINLIVLFSTPVSNSANLESFCLDSVLQITLQRSSGYDINIQTTPAFYLVVGNCEGEDVEKDKLGKPCFCFHSQLMWAFPPFTVRGKIIRIQITSLLFILLPERIARIIISFSFLDHRSQTQKKK